MDNPKIRVENLSMIFGPSPGGEPLQMLKDGVRKDDILEQTGHVVGVAEASFAVEENEIFVVMGLSGSGKSTLIRCTNRLLTPTAGEVFIDGENILAANMSRVRELRRTKMSMVFQNFALMPHKTVVENAGFGLKIRGLSASEQHDKAMEALDLVGLREWADYRPVNLSGGMQQRVGLARALATDPDILLMDEAFGALDPLIRRQMQNELLDLQDRLNKTVLFITHDLNEALRVGNRIAIMRAGRIIQIGTPVDIVTNPVNDYVAAFTQDVNSARVLTAEAVMKPAQTLTKGQVAVQEVVKQARQQDEVSAWYLVDSEDKPAGLVRRQQLLHAAENGLENLNEITQEDFPQAKEDDSLADMYALCAEGLPIAVLDKAGRLQGMVHPLDIFSTLATEMADEVPPEAVQDEEKIEHG